MLEKQNFLGYENYTSESPFEFSKHSSIGCGGRAEKAFYPKTVEEFHSLLSLLNREEKPYYIVGNMTNILPTDNQTEKTILCTKQMNAIHECDNGVYVLAGVTSSKLLRICRQLEKSGAEFLTGVPCTIGGALYMNAGAAGIYISEIVESVTVIRKGELTTLSAKECEYSYKKSIFMQNNDVIIGAKLALKDSKAEEIENRIAYYSARRAHLPKGKSMGCVFKNPEKGFAGEYIEKSGLKGLRFGNAKISEEHANFIINDANATSEEIKKLIDFIKNAVFSQYGVQLEEEIQYLT